MRYVNLEPGDPAPHFIAPTTNNPRFAFDTAAGRYLVLCFLGSCADPVVLDTIKAAADRHDVFDDEHASLFGVSLDPEDLQRLHARLPGVRYFWDFDGEISRLYGAIPFEAQIGARVNMRRMWIVLDPTLRVLRILPFQPGSSGLQALLEYVRSLPSPAQFAGFSLQAPILYLTDVFEPAFCKKLIALHEMHGGHPSGFMREAEGKTVIVRDPDFKRRQDYIIEDREIIRAAQARIQRRVRPQILKAFHFDACRMERYIVACYSGEDRGFFKPHRDNTTKGTAHRRFAVSINLNVDFDGGELWFPEYGPQGYRPSPGAAVVFSCSLLHSVREVTSGKRYAFLPFLYDNAAAALREKNNEHLGAGVQPYRMGRGELP